MPASALKIGDPGASSPAPGVAVIGVARTFSRDQRIYAQGDRAEFAYRIISGAVRSARVLADGRRQITRFSLPGDILGIESPDRRLTSAEALCETVVISARRSALMEDAAQQGALLRLTLRELERQEDHLLTLGRRTAVERVARFLCDLDDHTGASGSFALPMSRLDIADYLGLTIETVSRTLTQLQERAVVKIVGCRRVCLLRPADLRNLGQ